MKSLTAALRLKYQMNKTFGILAHVDAGKTTFAEDILYHVGVIKTKGRVDHKDSFMDSSRIEKERGITVFSDQAVFDYNSSTYYFLDTPGHADFSSEMERAVQVMDYAVLLISGVEGVEGQTEVIFNILKDYNVPTFFFINKMDREGADIKNVVNDIRANLTKDVCLYGDELIEFAAERNENLLEKYLNDEYEKSLWLKYIKKMIKERKIFPCFSGSALQDTGIDYFLEKFDELTYTDYKDDGEFSAIVYKVRHDDSENRIVFVKALSGTLNVKDDICEKVNEIRKYNGSKFKYVNKVSAGELFALTGFKDVSIGQGIGKLRKNSEYKMVPALKSKVIYDSSLNVKDVLKCFRILEDEDPSLNALWNEKLKEIQIHVMGIIQIEVLKRIIKDRFNIDVDFGRCEILYKETISKETMGYGHFEPLRHYAEVHLKLTPGKRGSGIIFESECQPEALSIGNQNLIRTHIFEREHHGVLTGSPVTDIKITLLTGRANKKHTSGGDFRQATFRALRQGLESTENVLLEPYYNFKIRIDSQYIGRVLSDIQKLNGTFDPPQICEDKAAINGRGPVSTFMNYGMEIIKFTKGRGKIDFMLDGYDICHNADEVIKKIGYDKDADIEYTSTSIFCSKGKSYLVKGKDAKGYMHCLEEDV